VRQRQQVPARGGAREAGALGGQRGVQALALGVEAFEHRHSLGDALDEIGSGDGHAALFGWPRGVARGVASKCCAIIAHAFA
jgi:hypothetical protein